MLLGLFHAFNYPCLPIECTTKQLLQLGRRANKRYGGIVGKRTSRNLFSWNLSKDIELVHLNFIMDQGIEIVHIVRNREDVLRSENGYVSEERYDAVQRQANEYGHAIKCNVRFEEILEDPLRVQSRLAKDLELRVLQPWTEYPNFVPLIVGASTRWPLRPIGADKANYKERIL